MSAEASAIADSRDVDVAPVCGNGGGEEQEIITELRSVDGKFTCKISWSSFVCLIGWHCFTNRMIIGFADFLSVVVRIFCTMLFCSSMRSWPCYPEPSRQSKVSGFDQQIQKRLYEI